MKTIILDRDGVINYDSLEYVKSPEEFIFIPGSLEAIVQLNQAGYRVVIATNQSGVARGFYTLEMLDKMHDKLRSALKALDGKIDAIFFCPHHPNDGCDCRKPKPGLLLAIQKKYNLDLSEVFFVGDNFSDVETALAAGCKPLLVLTGIREKQINSDARFDNVPRFKDLAEAVEYILG